ncbi:MAG: hypothetical protein ABS95_02765 [Verrucomicrobia bacterium SCN 57-15]|nr:MAG: hypothetical protein ABS95_02765 [Verrucomicrobia bacterium SCN 57-15]
MKQLSKLCLVTPVALALVLGMAGCATNQPKRQALVCPDCKMVEVTVENTSFGDDHPTTTTSTQMEHRCPNCRGAMKTFFKEGKFQHKCSACAQGAFTCPTSHGWGRRAATAS